MSRRYAPGTWFGAVSAQGVALLPADLDLVLVEGVWERLGRGKGLGGVLEALTGAFGTSLSAIPSFAVVLGTSAQARLAVRGPLTVRVRVRSGESVVVSGLGVTTWSERVIDDPVEIELLVDSAAPAELWFPLADGVALVSGIRVPLDARAEAVQPASPAPPAVTEAVAQMPSASVSVPEPEPALEPEPELLAGPAGESVHPEPASATDHEASEETWMPPVETAAPAFSLPAPAPADVDVDEYDHLWGATVVKPVAEAAVRPEPEPDSETTVGPVSAPSLPPIPAAQIAIGHPGDLPGDHDGETISLAQAQALRGDATADPAEPPLERPTPVRGRIVLSTGREVELDRSVVIGRRPRAVRVTGGILPHLIAVESPQQDISRSHVEIRSEGDAVLVVDLDTTNGTVLIREGAPPVRLHPGEPTIVIDGDVVDLGDQITVTFRGIG